MTSEFDYGTLAMTSQLMVQHMMWLGNCNASTWRVISNKLDTDFINNDVHHYKDVIMIAMVSDQRKHQSFASLAFVRDRLITLTKGQ